MKGWQELMQQAQAVQQKLRVVQEEVARLEVQGESGGGLVRVRMTGSHEVRGVHIERSLFIEDPAVIEDLVAAACNDAVRRLGDLQRERLADVAGGLGLPAGFPSGL
jgi:DNA-binding YbaB/EbfC family protein